MLQLDFDRVPRRILTLHECCGMLDASLATKFTVQFNLFGGTLLRLGTEANPLRHELLKKIDTLEEVGREEQKDSSERSVSLRQASRIYFSS